MRQAISQWLAFSVYDTEHSGSAEDALRPCARTIQAIVISDIKDARMGGIAVSEKRMDR